MSEEDLELFARRGLWAVTNPASNLKLSSGIAPVAEMQRRGVRLAIGTDGAASNNSLDIVKEAFILALLQKGINETPEKPDAKQVLKMLTLNGAEAQRRNGGCIKEGSPADFCIADLDRIAALPAYDPLETLIYCGSGNNIVMTAVDGVILYENGEYTTIDTEKFKFELERRKSKFGK